VQRVRKILQERMDKLFDQFDVVMAAGSNSPAQPLVPAPGGRGPRAAPSGPVVDNSNRAPDGISSLCGLPALSVPCGFSESNLPYGVQFIARATEDHRVISAARRFQAITEWHRKRPAIG